MVTAHHVVSASNPTPVRPYRRTFMVVESVLAVAGAAGALQLALGISTPPSSDIRILGLTNWLVPSGWLFLTVAVPSAIAAVFAWRRSYLTPGAVLVSGLMLGVELLVQIPFVGFNVLQVVFGSVAVALVVLGVLADTRWGAE